MNKHNYPRIAVAAALAAILLTGAAPPVAAQTSGSGTLRVSLPFDLVDTLDGARFKIRVPANWNGTLLVYLQGTKAVPTPEPAVVPPVVAGSTPALETTLLSRGYALAASDFGLDDMQAKEAAQDSLALTAYFRGRVGDPKRVLLWGTSMGGLISLKMAEEYPRSFHGALATCAPAAGVARNWDRHLDFALAYAVAFGWPEDKWGSLQQMRPGLNFSTDILPQVQTPKSDGSNRGLWEFIRLVRGISSDAFWGVNPVYGQAGWFLNVFLALGARSTIEAFSAGPISQNLDHLYTLTAAEKTYLAGLGVNADDLLAKMNARRNIAAAPWARDYAERFGATRGWLKRPALTLHDTQDNVAEAAGESAYRASVNWWGVESSLYQTFVNASGHCVFTSNQLLTGLAALERWVETGARPDPSLFPESLGFDNKFAPPPWPY